jgi:hypothetical protein
VGAGILALPYTTQEAGFVPSTAALAGVYVFSVMTGLLLAEANINLMCELGQARPHWGAVANMLQRWADLHALHLHGSCA